MFYSGPSPKRSAVAQALRIGASACVSSTVMARQAGRVLVLDHDGTLTRIKGYTGELAKEMSADFPALGAASEIRLKLESGMQGLCADPERTISIVPGTPASGRAGADSLIAAQVAVQDMLCTDVCAMATLRERYPGASCAATAYTTELHHKYKAGAAQYRDGVQAYVKRLKEAGVATYVVTNSNTEEISRSLLAWEDADTGAWLAARVRGGARKFAVEEGSDTLHIPGLRRGVSATRPHYDEILRAIMREEGAAAIDVTVVGDVLEFDLLLPLRLGMQVVLVGEDALGYEKRYVASSSRGIVRLTPWSDEEVPAVGHQRGGSSSSIDAFEAAWRDVLDRTWAAPLDRYIDRGDSKACGEEMHRGCVCS